jgi:hypothetical protein
MGAPKRLGGVLAVTAVLTLAACASKSTSSPTTVTVPAPVTTVAPAAGAGSGSDSNAAINQQVQNLNQSINQVSGDLSSADKAIANGG